MIQRIRETTDDPETAEQLLRRVYPTATLDEVPTDEPFRLEQSVDGDDELNVGRYRISGASRSTVDQLGYVSVVRMSAEHATLSAGLLTHESSVPVLAMPGATLESRMQRGRADLLQLSGTYFEDIAGRRWANPSTGWRPPLAPAPTPALAAYWERFASRIVDELTAGELLDNPLLRATTLETCAMTMLAVFAAPAEPAASEPSRPMPQSLRRALQYIDDHAPEPITVGDMADAARTTPRSLQASMRRHLGMTPLERLRQVRLNGAREELRTSATTVEAVARRWGFGNAGRFAGAYRREFGESPSATLRR